MRRRTLAFLFAALIVLSGFPLPLAAGASPAVVGQTETSEPVTSTTELPPAEMIPRPNSGVAPTDAGDRGGSLQTLVFVLVLTGTAFMAFLVWRESKKARTARGF